LHGTLKLGVTRCCWAVFVVAQAAALVGVVCASDHGAADAGRRVCGGDDGSGVTCGADVVTGLLRNLCSALSRKVLRASVFAATLALVRPSLANEDGGARVGEREKVLEKVLASGKSTAIARRGSLGSSAISGKRGRLRYGTCEAESLTMTY
jgi:hypothetical protein